MKVLDEIIYIAVDNSGALSALLRKCLPATPGMLTDDLDRIRDALTSVYRLALDGTAVGRINAAPGFAEAAASESATLTGLPFVTVHRQRPRW